MPALLTTPSSLPKLSTAVLTILLAGIASATVSKFATAVPPRFLISSTTSSAGEAFDPEPSAATPGSLTTTLAPSAAQSSAISRPMPRPAPVTTIDLPSSDLPCAMDDSRCRLLVIPIVSERRARHPQPDFHPASAHPGHGPHGLFRIGEALLNRRSPANARL